MSKADALLKEIANIDPEKAAQLLRLPPKARKELVKLATEEVDRAGFALNPGPQTQAWDSEANILLYGGEAGGGKSALLIMLALQGHRRSLIMRRQFTDLGAIIEDCLDKYGSRKGFSGAAPARLRTDDNRLIEFGAAKLPGDEQSWQGQAHDLLAFDEATQFLESQVRFLMGWVRPGPGVPEKQKCRTIFATNPPTSPAEGQWLKRWFAPWLDKTDPRYGSVKHGELLWRISDSEGEYRWVDGPDPVEIDGRSFIPQSLTFIPAGLDDNPFLRNVASYRSQLDSLPKVLRAAIRDGDWMISVEDDEYQVIPTSWALEAQQRWTREPPEDAPMCAMGVDVARGGPDKTIIQKRYDTWFGDPIAKPGVETPTGNDVASLILKYREHDAQIVIDMGGGYGGSVYDQLKGILGSASSAISGFNGANKSTVRTVDRQRGFCNKRAEAWWRFREALDPGQPGGSPIMLPHSSELIADLITPRFEDTPNGIKIESKKEIVKRLGRSPDYGDAVVMAWASGKNYTTHSRIWRSLTRTLNPPHRVISSRYANRKRRRA